MLSRQIRFDIAAAICAVLFLHDTRAAENRVDIAGDGPDVVLIPGMAADGAIMQPIVAHLAKCHRTHTVTLAGFAGQPANSGPKIQGWETALADYIATLPSRQATVIGHGMGGFVGLRLAIEHPDRVQRLVVLDSLPFPAAAVFPSATIAAAHSQADAAKQTMIDQPIEAFRTAQEQAFTSMTTHIEAVPTLTAWSLASDRATMADAYYEMLSADLRNAIGAIRAPTLVLVPWDTSQRQDAATTLDMYRKQYQKLPQARVQIVKGSRHFLMLDQPIASSWIIDDFVGKCP